MEPIIRRPPDSGWIEVICGSMFSGKTEELIRRLRRARIAKQQVAIFKPAIDSRYAHDAIVSHNANRIPSIPIESADQILLLCAEAAVIGIDEAQFFGLGLVDVCNQLAADGRRVLVVGLDMDYLGKPFEPIPQLMAIAEHVTKLHAICVTCGSPALYSHRLQAGGERVLIGEKEAYEPRCRACFDVKYATGTAESVASASETGLAGN